jgi:hypothetical protein
VRPCVQFLVLSKENKKSQKKPYFYYLKLIKIAIKKVFLAVLGFVFRAVLAR